MKTASAHGAVRRSRRRARGASPRVWPPEQGHPRRRRFPTATHGFTGGIVWWANEAKKELEKAHPDLKIIVKTAANAPEQANQLQDL